MRVITAAALSVALLATSASAQVSLWNKGQTGPANASAPPTGPSANLIRAVKSRGFEVHQIVNVIVHVSADSATGEQADFEKKNDKNNITINQYMKLQREGLSLNLKGTRPDDLGLDSTADRKYENDGSNERTDILHARLAAEIVDIKPNGNLVIEARQQFTKQRETTVITLSGVVRPQDVLPDNTVYSYNVADVDIRYESSGPVTDASKRGWLAKLLDKMWPF